MFYSAIKMAELMVSKTALVEKKSFSTLKNLTPDELINAYKIMLESRLLDEKMLILIRQGKSFFHIGCMGHEAVQVACALNMKKKYDFLFPYYRDQAFCMALGQSSYECLLAFLGKADDPHAGGRQMPMHYGNKQLNIPSSSSSTGTQFLQAVGNALACKRLFEKKEYKELPITICTCGDGTTSQGEFYEALSWAAKDKAPIIFLVENNKYAISVEINEQRPGGVIGQNFKNFYGIEVFETDGCDFIESYKTTHNAINRARAGKGPSLIDAEVVRLLPHSSSDDHKKYRDQKSLEKDLLNDPIKRMENFLLNERIVKAKEIESLRFSIKEKIESDVAKALTALDPNPQTATNFVFSSQNEPLESAPKIDEKSEQIVMVDAINRAIKEEMILNPKVIVFGEDVALNKGGVFTATRGLTEQFGQERCFNSPLAEASIVGVAIGYALRGFTPVVEIQFADYIWTAMMQIRNELTTLRYRSNNDFSAPVVIRVPVGGYIHGGLCHSQNIEATFAHFPGIKIALPSTAIDAYGLLKTAINSEDPVLFLEHKALYRQNFAKSFLPNDNQYKIPFGKGVIRKQGSDICVITYGILVQRALEAASKLADEGIDVMVIDLRTIVPYDKELVLDSVKKVGKVLVLHEDMRFVGFGAEIASEIAESCFSDLDAPIKRLAAKDTPVPYAQSLEDEILPTIKDILLAIKNLAAY